MRNRCKIRTVGFYQDTIHRHKTGNAAQILEYPLHDVRERSARGDRLLTTIRREGRALSGTALDELTVVDRVAGASQDR